MILGLGSDLIDIRRVERSIERFGDRFLLRIFTETERVKSDRRAQRAASYAKRFAAKNGIEPHAGHGLTYENVQPIAAIPQLAELNIGHYLIGEAIFVGLEASIRHMRALMDEARQEMSPA